MHCLPFDYHHNVKVCMVGNIVKVWSLSLEHQRKAEKWKILLPADNCLAHKNVPHHGENIKVVFLLSNSMQQSPS
jgi:hypothetical protein